MSALRAALVALLVALALPPAARADDDRPPPEREKTPEEAMRRLARIGIYLGVGVGSTVGFGVLATEPWRGERCTPNLGCEVELFGSTLAFLGGALFGGLVGFTSAWFIEEVLFPEPPAAPAFTAAPTLRLHPPMLSVVPADGRARVQLTALSLSF